jgi:hypothetical protein
MVLIEEKIIDDRTDNRLFNELKVKNALFYKARKNPGNS